MSVANKLSHLYWWFGLGQWFWGGFFNKCALILPKPLLLPTSCCSKLQLMGVWRWGPGCEGACTWVCRLAGGWECAHAHRCPLRHVQACLCMHVCADVCVSARWCVHVCRHMHIHAHMHVPACRCMQVHMDGCVCVCTCMRVNNPAVSCTLGILPYFEIRSLLLIDKIVHNIPIIG